MADIMEFPNTTKEFIDSYSFKDSKEIYTNGAELISVFRVEQGLEHYAKEIRAKAIDDLMEKVSECFISDADWNYLVQEAEQLKEDKYHAARQI